MSVDGGAPDPLLHRVGDGEGDGQRETMADAETSLSEAITTLQDEIDTLKAEIKEGDDEMKAKGRDFEQRAAVLKPKEDRLVKLEDRLTELEKQKRIAMEQQQLRTQAGAPAPGMRLVPLYSLVQPSRTCSHSPLLHPTPKTITLVVESRQATSHSLTSLRARLFTSRFDEHMGIPCA